MLTVLGKVTMAHEALDPGDFAELRALGVTDEAIVAMKAIWSGEPVTIEGLHFTAAETIALPVLVAGVAMWMAPLTPLAKVGGVLAELL